MLPRQLETFVGSRMRTSTATVPLDETEKLGCVARRFLLRLRMRSRWDAATEVSRQVQS